MVKRPNIIFFCADQMRYDGVDCLGNPAIRTPNIGAIGRGGACFHMHRTPLQICSPSRATMFTGLYPRHHGLYKNGNALDPAHPVLADVLAAHGYRTHGVGKFHLQPLQAPVARRMPESIAFWGTDEARDWRGPYYGFETVDIVLGEGPFCLYGGHYAQWFKHNYPDAAPLYEPDAALEPIPEDLFEVWKCALPAELHYDTWIADRAAEFVQAQDDEQPFFLYVSFPDPHHPFSPPQPYCNRYDPASVPMPQVEEGELDRMPPYVNATFDEWAEIGAGSYEFVPEVSIEQGAMIRTDGISEATLRVAIAHTYGMIEMIDDGIARIVAALEERGLADHTILIFTSDHGELLGDHGLLRKGAPPYDQLVRLPFLMRGPGIPDGLDVDTPTGHIDLMATLCDLTGVQAPASDGLSLTPLLKGETEGWTREVMFGEFYPRAHWNTLNHSLYADGWRLTLYPREPEWGELFDHTADPGEHRNLFDDPVHAETRACLTDLLQQRFPAVLEDDSEVLGLW